MISTDSYRGGAHNGTDMALVSRQSNNRGLTRQQSNQGQVSTYQRQSIDRNNPGHLQSPPEAALEKNTKSNSHKAHQNAEAIVRYNVNAKGKVNEGRHANAVDQIHQNDLHNIEEISEMPQYTDKYAPGNGIVVALPEQPRNVPRETHANTEQVMGVKPQMAYSQDSDLITSFDPMRDRHTWTMWRTAVNGRIVDEVRQLERLKAEKGDANGDLDNTGLYGTALVVPPLRQFIKFDNDDSKLIAAEMSTIGQWSLQLPQFVYFGIPRVRMAPPKQ